MPNGKGYEGEWKDNKYNGKGVKFFPNGSKYEGFFKDNRPIGKGKRYLGDGKVQVGEWDSGKWIPIESSEIVLPKNKEELKELKPDFSKITNISSSSEKSFKSEKSVRLNDSCKMEPQNLDLNDDSS